MPTPRKPKSEGQKESRRSRLFAPVQKFFRSLSPSPSSSSQHSSQPPPGASRSKPTDAQSHAIQGQGTSNKQQGANDLWSKAFKQLPEEYKKDLENLDKVDILQKLFAVAKQAEEQNAAKQFKLKWGDKEIDVREKAEGFVGWLNKFKEIGDIAVQYDPVHAALPWAGVRFILMLVIGHQEKLAAAFIAMERIAILLGRCTIYEQLYLSSNDIPDIAEKATQDLRAALLSLYTAILQALSGLMVVFNGKTNPLNPSETTLAEIKSFEEPESVVNLAASVVDKCYNSHARLQNKGDSLKLRDLLQDFFPVISRIDATVTAMDDTVTALYEEIKEQERITILKWFSTVPYKSHHDFAREGCVEHTGSWLFKRNEFNDWQQSRKPNLLWLHGIPGAGKTKLVSATVERLSEISHGGGGIDKVVFFYCKRDEEDRRDRQKILLALVKQLACPPATDTGIYTEALEAYKQEQKDPSSRGQLSIQDSLQLLNQLLKRYKHPAIILDALDECSEEARGFVIEDLRSILDKAKHPVKVLIVSRHSLDIEDSLQDLLHVGIEGRDNAEDIENYVTKELTLRVQKKKLLRGTISLELKQLIKDVLLRDANGMFLWVDYQLRDLCKLCLESDVRARLGKLPKNLSGVYDEIMNSIEARPGTDFELGTRALKWMLVSQRPLTPQQLVAATELNPSYAPPQPLRPPPEPSLNVELVIHVCGGLILLDQELDVMRFAHLSVQEYLETRKNSWGIIDAQRFVSEGCLWTLQCGPSLMPALYDYAGHNWFRHCRSYQDIALTQRTQGPNHALDIPILNTFLGSFDRASICFAVWVDWLKKNKVHGGLRLYLSVPSKPLRPAFAAVVSGLGELVSWLWHSEGADMQIKNEEHESLLYFASKHGTTWIMECVLARGAELDINEVGSAGTALCGASCSGVLEKATLLLDRGADTNITFSGAYGTALEAAAYWGRLEMATLLLDRGADINLNSGGKYGTALGAAALRGRQGMARLLLNRGADINLQCGKYGTALGAAAAGGSLEIATLLLDRGADINLHCGEYGTALGAAAWWGKLEMATLLLGHGADTNLPCGKYGTALGAAAAGGKLEIAMLLLDRGADIDLPCDKYGTALGAAAAGGKLEMATLLLERGADINIQCGEYGTALGMAAWCGNLEMATLLLDQGADLNLPCGTYGNALDAAAWCGKLELATLLLGRGADINLASGKYGTTLGAAAYWGRLDIATLLVDRGADINLTFGGEYGTALGAAAACGWQAVARLLLERGADINLQCGEYGTALGAAALWGQLEMATLLLDQGADINITFGGKYGTALGAAAAGGKLEIAMLLLDRGADTNLTFGGEYGSALGAAAAWGGLEIATLLLDRGADTNLPCGEYGTALGAAAWWGNLEMITLLLDQGADINLKCGKYGNALGAAVAEGELEIATLLLDRGTDINLTFGGKYGTALGAAAAGGNLEMASLLLDRGSNTDLTNNLGQKPRDLAELEGRHDMVRLLDSYRAGKPGNQTTDTEDSADESSDERTN